MGKATPRIDGAARVTGGMKYVYDMEVSGMLYGRILRSPIAHGFIKRIDTSRAEGMEGVVAVVTAKDTPKKKFSFEGGIVPSLPDKLILCDDKVRYIGDEVAAVAAESPEIAEEALQNIEVEYEELPGVFEPEEALKVDAPKIHSGGNLSYSKVFQIGNVDHAFKQEGLLFVEHKFVSQKAAHVCLEPKGCIADWDQGRDEVEITTTTQAPHTLKQELSRTLDIPTSRLRVFYPASGGGFGSKLVMSPIEPIACILSKKTGRPVKIVNTREEEFTVSRTDYPYHMDVKLGFTREGKIIGIDAKIIVDNGAYNDKGPAVLTRSTLALGSHYAIPNIRATSFLVYTNKQYCTAFRGFGKPQAVFAVESIMDIAAEKLGIDSIKFREINTTRPGEKTPTGVPIFNDGLERCVMEVTKRIGWWERKKRTLSDRNLSKRYLTGIGVAIDAGTAAGNRKYGYNSCDAFLKFSEDGRATLITSGVEIGTGAVTAIAQIVAEILMIDLQNVEIRGYDTAVTPYDLGVFGNRTLFIHGNAAASAANNAKKELLQVAAGMFGVAESDIVMSSGHFEVKDRPERKATIKEIVGYALSKLGKTIAAKGEYVDADAPLAPLGKAPIDPTYSFAAHAVELRVDTETGVVKILRYVAVHDSGTIINPLTAKGVVIGGVVQGIGYTLMEELLTEEGRVINPNFLDYKIPAMEESPPVEVVFVNVPDPLGPFGAKGLGENAVSPPVATIANAIYDAIGIRFYQLPITPVKILGAILERKRQSLEQIAA
ncbi:MAG: xanthine dehydrogenase family protein molybdopterin-binding subunit [Nitrososphaerales archaeon]